MPERVTDSEEVDNARRGFLKLFFPQRKYDNGAATVTSPAETGTIDLNRRAVLKAAMTAGIVVATGALEGCGALMDATPEGDWFNEKREAFPLERITLAPEIEATLSPEGKANVLRIIAEQFTYIPKAFWKEIARVHVGTLGMENTKITVADDKVIRLSFEIVNYASLNELDTQLWFGEGVIRDRVTQQVGMHWYTHLSKSQKAIIGTFSPEGSDPIKGLGEGFRFHLLYPDAITLILAYADKYGLSELLGNIPDNYNYMRSAVFDEHDFEPPSFKVQESLIKNLVIARVPGFEYTHENWLSFLNSLRDNVGGRAQASVDYARAKNNIFLAVDKGFDKESWEDFQAVFTAALVQAETTRNSQMIAELKVLEIEASVYREPWKKPDEARVRALLDKAKKFLETASSATDKRELATLIFDYILHGYIMTSTEEFCYWHAISKKLNQGTAASPRFVGDYVKDYCKT